MGQRKFREVLNAPFFNGVQPFLSTAATIANRVVKMGAVAGTVKHTTGTSGRIVLGVALNATTGGGKRVMVQMDGVATIVASTRAIAAGAPVRATSGSASTASFAGGTVRQATGNVVNSVGLALTSCAAAATIRTISVKLAPTYNNASVL